MDRHNGNRSLGAVVLSAGEIGAEERERRPVFSRRLPALGPGQFPAPETQVSYKSGHEVATWHFSGGQNANPANIISTNVYGALEGGGRYWI